MKNIIEHWDAEHGVFRCVIPYKASSGAEFEGIGVAECHPDDNDFMSELTGSVIAGYRAEIDLIKKINKYEISPAIVALKHVYCSMYHSKKYNPDSYEAIRLKKELAHLMDEYAENKQTIQTLKEYLSKYINDKDSFYQRLRNGQK